MEEHWATLLYVCKWIEIIMAVFFGVLEATGTIYEDMSQPKPRFPKNPLRRTFCWLFLSTIYGPLTVAYLEASLLWGLTVVVVTIVLLLLQPVLFILHVILAPAFGSFDSSKMLEVAKGLDKYSRELWEYWMRRATYFSIWLAGGFLECGRCAARDQISAQMESSASSG